MTEKPIPLAYFLTFTSYGTWLHGDPRGSVERHRSTAWGTPRGKPSRLRLARMQRKMKGDPMWFQHGHRSLCTSVIAEVCQFRGWQLHAANVRTNHVHAVVTAVIHPEKILGDFKARCTLRLREEELVGPDDPVWTNGGSTRYLFTPEAVQRACEYVLREQGAEQGFGEAVDWE